MNITRTGLAIAAVAAASALVLSGCAANENGGDSPSNLSGSIAGVGSSAQGAAQEAWIAAFRTNSPNATITYDPRGSGAGVTAFMEGEALFAGSDSPLKDDELAGTFAACAPDTAPFEIANYISAIAVVYNVEGVDDLNLDAATIAKIFTGTITAWNDPAIAALNVGAVLPGTAITAVHHMAPVHSRSVLLGATAALAAGLIIKWVVTGIAGGAGWPGECASLCWQPPPPPGPTPLTSRRNTALTLLPAPVPPAGA